jgi:hypothetical protein
MKLLRTFRVLILAFAVLRCGESSGPRVPADIELSAADAAFMATSGGASPAPVVVQITNPGDEPLTELSASIAYADGQPVGWLTVTLSSASAPSILTIAASLGGLRGGLYTGTVTVASPVAAHGPLTIDVTFDVASAAPAAPSNLAAIAPTDARIELSWTDNSPVEDGFRIERCEGDGCADFSYVTGLDSNVTSYAHVGFSVPSTSYRYRIQSVNAEGLSAFSNIAEVTTPAIPPLIQLDKTSLTFHATAGGVNPGHQTVTVTNAGGGTLDNLVLGSTYTGGPEGWLGHGLEQTTAPTTLTVTAVVGDLPPGTSTATVTVSAALAGNASQTIAVTLVIAPPLGDPPAAPSDLVVTRAFSNSITIQWTDNATDEDGFRIERCSGIGCTAFAEVALTGADVGTYSFGLIEPSTSYSFRVRASGAGGNSSYSNLATVETPSPDAPPAAPSDLTATAASATEIDVAWTDNSLNEYDFYIERAPAGTTDFVRIASVTTNVTTYRDVGRTPATSYSYRVQGFNGNEPAPYSNTATATTPP